MATPSHLVVADGMGGAPDGDLAAQFAVDALDDCAPATAQELVAAFGEAHGAVARQGQEWGHEGMGCALVAVVAGAGGDMIVANVGDARAYIWRGGTLVLLTSDHNEAQLLVEAGVLTSTAARSHPASARLTRMVGPREMPAVDVRTIAVGDGDRVLVCSDGLTAALSDAEIVEILLAEPDNGDAADHLLVEACRRGAHDNVTVVVATPVPAVRQVQPGS